MRLSIVEDDTLLCENLKILLNAEAGITVVSNFTSAFEALSNLKSSNPEILLVDLGLPGMSGIDLIRQLKDEMTDLEIIVHTVFEDKETVLLSIKAGASGYILKGCTSQQLVNAIREVYNGGAPMTPKIARKIVMEFQDKFRSGQQALSDSETEILHEIESGMTYKEIAAKFNLSPQAVNVHIKNIYGKIYIREKNFHDGLVEGNKPLRNNRPATFLTEREKEVLNWIKQGKSSWDISIILGISEATVKFHVGTIMKKLNAVSRVHAVTIAISMGLIDAR